MPVTPTFFQFEADFVESLRCIPMQVRYKLDTCGVKLKLHHWHQLEDEERQGLVEMPCATIEQIADYRRHLRQWVRDRTGETPKDLALDPDPPWLGERVPGTVREKGRSLDVSISDRQWAALTPLQRFALIKLSRPSHENRNFYPALQEFGLV
ncbi:nitrate reductase associated protein [Phormidium yuhuli AB48]|uniref:Nitrate reductase associated protein n=1 Tax=Phormidium yuhuli AB48 TaxID=2940671 RepID=A0ABY5AP74_9CYAN|nr:nitrate reductase associated protein [Phormidium yuhuli]USR91005.1 nitrate reductase associated protein [Phormidium yuhuli AB48]